MSTQYRLTQFANGGGCSCKIPPGELDDLVAGLAIDPVRALLVGLENGDDGAAIQIDGEKVLLTTADFFTPVVDDAYDWGRIAAANALSDIYAMGGSPLVAVNLVGWPRDKLPLELLAEVLRGGQDIARQAICAIGGGHSIDDPEPKYGMAVTGLATLDSLLRNDAAEPGLALSLTKPLGIGILNNRHKATGEDFPEAVASMVALNDVSSRAAIAAGVKAATDVTGFGLLGHLHKMLKASGISAVIEHSSVPYVEGARESAERGFISGGTERNLRWVRDFVDTTISDSELLLLADAQTSGGLLVVGEIPGGTVVGYTTRGNPGRVFIV